jgi:mRNA interferase RelE/StbE
MIYQIIIQDSAQKELRQLPKNEFKKVEKVILSLAANPFPNGCLKLEGVKQKLYRIRKGDYRIIYSVSHQIITVTILKVANRKDAYKD